MRILERVPGYSRAAMLSVVDASHLTSDRFTREYVNRLRPCLVRGAVRHWPASGRWRDLDYIRQKIGNPTLTVATAPLVESQLPGSNKDSFSKVPFGAVLDHYTSGAPGHYVLHAYPLSGKSPLAPLGEDVLGFPFLGPVGKPRLYAPQRAFLFRDSYTDWHYHITDETFMCQVKGDKEVLLLPPDASSLELTTSIRGKNAGRLWDIDVEEFPAWKTLRAYRVVVSEGDALYIPTFWQHAVESIGSDFGWTVAWCWRTPPHLFDPRLAGVRLALKSALGSRMAPIALAAAAWSVLSLRCLRRPPYAV